MTEAVAPAPRPGLARDLVTLGKPGITMMCALMAAGAMYLAPTSPPPGRALAILAALSLCVMAANALNMYLERDGDRHMARTRQRPLAAGRMRPGAVLAGGLVAGIASVALLSWLANPLTGLLGLLSIVSYVWLYTPMKRRSWWALIVGAFPGAAPPLMGYTAATGRIDAVGLTLFLILLVWQIPHFIAIALYRRADYERAGIRTLPSERGEDTAKVHALAWSLALVPVSLMLVPLGIAGFIYFLVASALGAWFFVFCLRGFEPQSGAVWARRFFLATLAYLPLLVVGLVADIWIPL